ncbi:hypothetical protein H2200_013246 [Cladophialophora chaetospira]|uniref:F-box domain-containing protein n=1 Tax=Cladophialophora chaetospira TaxID=386627 RepID=A0AA39CBM3_9EURO|nr:hypothetical protein H2200_013246 [Cladophialophora chaetospira]
MARVRSAAAPVGAAAARHVQRRRFIPYNKAFIYHARSPRLNIPSNASPRPILRAVSRPKRAKKNTNARRLSFLGLPIDLIYLISDKLDDPSRISLGLTCKALALVMTVLRRVKICINDSPTFLSTVLPRPRYTRHGRRLYRIELTPTFSDRRILLLQLKPFMPRSHRLCWMCCKYTPITGSRWHETSQVNTLGNNALTIERLKNYPLRKVYAHEHCMTEHNVHGRALGKWCLGTAGAAGGKDTYEPTVSVTRASARDDNLPYDCVGRSGWGKMWVHDM